MSGLGEWLDEVEERDLAATSIRRWYDAEWLIDLRFSNGDAEFIAHAREDVPRLVGMLRRALDRDALAQAIRRIDGNHDMGAAKLADALVAYIEGTETGR